LSTPKIAIEVPTFTLSNACNISLPPGTIAGQYHRFFITAHAERLTFFNLNKARSTQKRVGFGMPNNPQHAVWYSFPKGWGLRGQNSHPGQVHRLCQMDINSSRTHNTRKIFAMCSLKVAIISRTSQNLFQNVGRFDDVNRNADVIATNRRHNM
jgi:hypothetical protein